MQKYKCNHCTRKYLELNEVSAQFNNKITIYTWCDTCIKSIGHIKNIKILTIKKLDEVTSGELYHV